MHDESKPGHIISDSIVAIGKARLSLNVLSKRWHRDGEDKALRYAMEQIDKAGILLSGLQEQVEGQSERSRQVGNSGL